MRKKGTRGQALVMVTFALTALLGIMALAVDMGLAHFNRKSAQSAADAAAKASIMRALENMANGPAVCGANVGCEDNWGCPANVSTPPTNLDTACLYARQNGFANSGATSVTLTAHAAPPGPPTAAGVNDVFYWVTVTVTQRSPRLFSAVFGADAQLIAVRATAAVTNGVAGGALFALNRQNDTSPMGTGKDLVMGGNPSIVFPGGIYLASTAAGTGEIQGTSDVDAPFTRIRGSGTTTMGGSSSWDAAPKNNYTDSWYFKDPMGGKGQPPALPSGGLPGKPVPGGILNNLPQPLQPGQYYAVDNSGKATGAQLIVSAPVTFSDAGSGFGNYVLYGGLSFSNSGRGKFSPGRYVLAGVKNPSSPILSVASQSVITDYGVANQPPTDAGEIFIFTDAKYPGLDGFRPPDVETIKDNLGFGPVNLQAGNKQVITLHGLNRESPVVPANLKDFAPTAFWQDQRNSRIEYDANGNVDYTSCGGGHTLDTPCLNPGMQNSTTPEFKLQAHPMTSIYGLIYQPRGAWMRLQGNGSITSPLILITGALDLQGGANIATLDPRDALRMKMAALVE